MLESLTGYRLQDKRMHVVLHINSVRVCAGTYLCTQTDVCVCVPMNRDQEVALEITSRPPHAQPEALCPIRWRRTLRPWP